MPLIEAYQRSCRVPNIERGRNRGFFGRLIAPSQFGMLLGAWRDEVPAGYACLTWGLDSAHAHEIVTLQDLWVEAGELGKGVERALIDTAADMAHARGAQALIWPAEPDDFRAQELCDSLGAARADWVRYSLKL